MEDKTPQHHKKKEKNRKVDESQTTEGDQSIVEEYEVQKNKNEQAGFKSGGHGAGLYAVSLLIHKTAVGHDKEDHKIKNVGPVITKGRQGFQFPESQVDRQEP